MVPNMRKERAEPDNRDDTRGWHVPGKKSLHFDSIIAKLKIAERSDEFYDNKATRFCEAMRVVGTLLIHNEAPNKKAITKKHSLAAREYNSVLGRATAMIESARTLLENKRSTVEGNITSLTKKIADFETELTELQAVRKTLHWKRGLKNLTTTQRATVERDITKNYYTIANKAKKLHGLKAKLARAEVKLTIIPKQPHVFMFGKEAYYNQPSSSEGFVTDLPYQHETPAMKAERLVAYKKEYKAQYKAAQALWRKEWLRVRNSMFGARGSSDEAGGNSTFRISFTGTAIKITNYLGRKTPSPTYHFAVSHGKHGIIGRFSLSQKEGETLQKMLILNNAPLKKVQVMGKIKKGKIVYRADTTGRVPLKVEFHHQKGSWHIHIIYPLDCLPKNNVVNGAIGIDTNHGHFDSCEMTLKDGKFIMGEYRKNRYDINAPRGRKKHAISAHIRAIVYQAQAKGHALVMENLDWEGGQKIGSKLGATLSAMPYRTLLFKVMRECARLGVPFRLVWAGYTSLLGNIVSTENIRLSRDVAAAAVIAMRGLSPRLLDAHLQEILNSDRVAYLGIRINEKGEFGRHIAVLFMSPRRNAGISDNFVACAESDTGETTRTDRAQAPGSYSKCVGDALSKVARSVRSARTGAPGRILSQISCRTSSNTGKPNPIRCKTSLIGSPHLTCKMKNLSSMRVLNFEQV